MTPPPHVSLATRTVPGLSHIREIILLQCNIMRITRPARNNFASGRSLQGKRRRPTNIKTADVHPVSTER
jgi:hypothetical protein